MKRCAHISKLTDNLASSGLTQRPRVLVKTRKSVTGSPNASSSNLIVGSPKQSLPPKPLKPRELILPPPVPVKPTSREVIIRNKSADPAVSSSVPAFHSMRMGAVPSQAEKRKTTLLVSPPSVVLQQKPRTMSEQTAPLSSPQVPPKAKQARLSLSQAAVVSIPQIPLEYYNELAARIPEKPAYPLDPEDKRQKQYAEVFNEFINTEEGYVRGLAVIIGVRTRTLLLCGRTLTRCSFIRDLLRMSVLWS